MNLRRRDSVDSLALIQRRPLVSQVGYWQRALQGLLMALRSGFLIRARRFDSGRRLQPSRLQRFGWQASLGFAKVARRSLGEGGLY
jgi:hypothetical protein